jgi:DNA polymerase elongation subunit (family B)
MKEIALLPQDMWLNSIFSTARHYGGCIISGKEYKIVTKFGYADLVRKDWIPIYKYLGREKIFELIKNKTSIQEAKVIVKQLKEKEKSYE